MDRSGAARLPASLTDWIADLWSRQLFPGTCKGDDSPPSLRSLAILIILPAILLYPCLGFHLFEPDESRYAQIPREMLDRSDLIVPTLQGEPYLDKPPLFYWMVMLSYRIFGAHDWSARLVPAIAAHLTLLMTYLLGRRTMGERPAFWAALVLALAPGFLGMSRLLILDGLLTLFVALALFAGYEALRGDSLRKGWWILASVAVGLAVLTKGPVALLLFLPPLWLHRRLSGKGCVPSRGDVVLFGLIVLGITLPWYIALSLRLPEFVRYFFWEHNVKRFLAPDVHVRGIWFYFPILWLVLFPTTLLLLPAARFLSRLTPDDADRRSVHLGFHLLAGGWCVLFFTLSACKLPTYILPALPFLALGLGAFLVETDLQSSRLFRHSLQASFALMLLGHYLVLPWYAWYRSPMSRPADVLALCADRDTPVVCYPRNCDSIAFYLGRSDLRNYRSKEIEELRYLVRTQPRTVILCTHRHSLQGLKQLLPPEVRVVQERRMGLADIPGVPPALMKPLAKLMGETALGLADLAVVEMPSLVQAGE